MWIFHNTTLTEAKIDRFCFRFRDEWFRGETPDEYFDRITGLVERDSLNDRKVQILNGVLSQWLTEKEYYSVYDVGAG